MTVPPRPSPTSFDYQVQYCDTGISDTTSPESIECFKEDQASLRSYDSAQCPPPPVTASCLSFSLFLCIAGKAYPALNK
jgi:hypothetical protein